MADEAKAGAAQVLEHGTAKTRAAAEKKPDGKEEKGLKGKKGKKRIKRMVIEPADDGSHVIRHEHHQPDGDMGMRGQHVPDETYTAPDTEALKEHIQEHLGGGAEGETETAAEGKEAAGPAEEEAAAAGG